MTFKFRTRTNGKHTHVTVFCGEPERTLANVGNLTMLPEEWLAL